MSTAALTQKEVESNNFQSEMQLESNSDYSV